MKGRRESLATLAALGLAPVLAPRNAHAQRFPDRAVKVLVGFPPGGTTDTVMRVLAQAAGAHLGQQVLIDNKPGGGGVISIQAVKAAPPDGYTLGLFTLSVFRSPWQVDAGYDALRDLTYIIGVTNVLFAIVVRADAPWKSWKELSDAARAAPGKLTYGVPAGLGNSGHLVMSEVASRDRLDLTVVPYKGSADCAQALLGGQVNFAVDASGGFGPLVDSGRARLLAVAADERSSRWTDVPTLKELGYDMSIDSPWGIGGPAGMDRALVQTLHDAFRKAMAEKAVTDSIARFGQSVRYMSPDDYSRYAIAEYAAQKTLLTKYGFVKKD